MYLHCTHSPKEEQPCVGVGPLKLNKVECESESSMYIHTAISLCGEDLSRSSPGGGGGALVFKGGYDALTRKQNKKKKVVFFPNSWCM